MNVQAFIYTAIIKIFYLLASPFIALFNRDDHDSNALLIYFVLRCNGYSKAVARWIVKQSAHETAYWSSNLYKNGNNLFGMKMPSVRPTTANGTIRATEGVFARFSSKYDSIKDRMLWDIEFKNTHKIMSATETDYYLLLKEDGYAENIHYFQKVEAMDDKLDFKLGTLTASFYAMLVITVIVYKRYNK